MGWGGDEYAGVAVHRGPQAVERRRDLMLFVTSDERARAFCETITAHPALMMKDTKISHHADHESLTELVGAARLLVIATCRESLDKGSAAQEREKHVAAKALELSVPVVILSGENHEAVQDHLAIVRGRKPLVIVPPYKGHFGEGFTDCFPIGTEFLERSEAPDSLETIARKLLTRAA